MLKTRHKRVKLRDLTLLEQTGEHENARFMKPAAYQQLVSNLREDQALTSAPLVGRQEDDDRLLVLSGNHRVAAAIDAGIEEADCIEIIEPLDRQKLVALQLSHNAIEGEDDPVVLRRLYDELTLDLKEYSGLTDNDFDVDDLDVSALGTVSPMYAEVTFSFLMDDAQSVEQFFKTAERWSEKGRPTLACHYEQFERFFDAIVKVKDLRGVSNSAIAMAILVEMAEKQIESETAELEAKEQSG